MKRGHRICHSFVMESRCMAVVTRLQKGHNGNVGKIHEKWGTSMSYNDRFIRACRKEQVDRVPVWYMRQAGRYDPDYRKIKEKYSLLEICKQPELAAEVTHDAGQEAWCRCGDFVF